MTANTSEDRGRRESVLYQVRRPTLGACSSGCRVLVAEDTARVKCPHREKMRPLRMSIARSKSQLAAEERRAP
jgi:hypothetical protein